jgi:hypothetical protein
MDESHKAVRYFLDRAFRAGVMFVMNRITVGAREREPDRRGEDIKKVLLVRSLFRMGDSILAIPLRTISTAGGRHQSLAVSSSANRASA